MGQLGAAPITDPSKIDFVPGDAFLEAWPSQTFGPTGSTPLEIALRNADAALVRAAELGLFENRVRALLFLDPPKGVLVVSRDHEENIAPGLYNICYVNGFQTQPQDNDGWAEDHPELLVRDDAGNPILDEDWGEYLFDVSTVANREALVDIVAPWLEGCAAAGFNAIDNLDSYTRSNGALSEDDAVAYIAALSDMAHQLGLAMGQKNSAELFPRKGEMGTDFAVAEECNRYDECGDNQEAYGDLVFVIEYRKQDFDAGCEEHPDLSIVLRDRNVTSPSANGYVYEGC